MVEAEKDLATLLTWRARASGAMEFQLIGDDPVSERPSWDGVVNARMVGMPK